MKTKSYNTKTFTDYRDKGSKTEVFAIATAEAGTGEIKTPIQINFNRTQNRIYCTLFVYFPKNGFDFVSSAYAGGGYGYDKQTAALGKAIKKAGIELPEYPTTRQTIEALANELGIDGTLLQF